MQAKAKLKKQSRNGQRLKQHQEIQMAANLSKTEPLCDASRRTGLVLVAMNMPHWQFNTTELGYLCGLSRTTISRIKQEPDSPFAAGKCTLGRLSDWLAKHPGYKVTAEE